MLKHPNIKEISDLCPFSLIYRQKRLKVKTITINKMKTNFCLQNVFLIYFQFYIKVFLLTKFEINLKPNDLRESIEKYLFKKL